MPTLADVLRSLSLPDGTAVPTDHITVQQLCDLLNAGGQGANGVSISLKTLAEVGQPTFAAKLRLIRVQKGLTQAELASKAGMHLQTVTQYEIGRKQPTTNARQKLANALNIKVEELNTI